ncbi:MAG TPA: hypothetical protein VHU77_07705 [Candidatus Limnocylindria bacterium]|nr:hypothetical protein [Candidatus Limnocylindria bacterium]
MFGAAAAGAAVLLALTSYALLTYALARPLGIDVSAYYHAAERLASGETLYAGGAANASDLYRYSPWFAAAWIPLTALPIEVVAAPWVGLMGLAALLSTAPLVRFGPTGWAAFAFFFPLQLQGAAFGNVQPLLVLMLVCGVNRPSGPLWVAIGASLKLTPIVVVLVYAARGEWGKVWLTIGLTVLLVAPMLLFDLSGYSTQSGPNQDSLAGVSPLLFLPIAAVTLLGTWLLARTRYGWAAAGLAMIMSLPRLLSYEAGFALVGLADVLRQRGVARP